MTARSRCSSSPMACAAMALVVDEIVDIVEDTLNIEIPSEQPGILGSAVIKGEATEIIDVGISCRWPSPTGSAAPAT